MATKFTIGCDPEIFVRDASGVAVTAHGMVEGDKKAPKKVNKGAYQVDGMALEFNTDPVDIGNFEAFNDNIITVLGQMKAAIPEGFGFIAQPSITFAPEYYAGVPAEAKVLGCDPDYCAYSIDIFEPNPRPDGDSGLRSAAGHIHIGWGSDIPTDHPDHIDICRNIIKQLDWTVGLGMCAIDSDTERRKIYGKAGAYRPKSYGVEYRTPSNVWIFSKSYRRFIHRLVNRAITDMSAGRIYDQLYTSYGNPQTIINEGDQGAAAALLKQLFGISIPAAPTPKES
jgi:hypothetical protein